MTPDARRQTPDARRQTPDARRQDPRRSAKDPVTKAPKTFTPCTKTKNRSKLHTFIFPRRLGLFLRLLGGFIFALLSIAFLQLVSTTANAGSISAQTYKTIEGSAPGLALYGSSTPATSAKELVSFIIDDEGTEKIITPDTPPEDIVIDGTKPLGTQVKTVLAPNIPNGDLALNTLADSVIKVLDIDGDSNPANRLNEIKGRINVQWSDKDDTPLTTADLQAAPDICRTPYKLKMAVTDAQAQTAYGAPNVSPKLSATNTYSINTKNVAPRFCYAQPALTPHHTMTNPQGEVVPPLSVWNPKKGFLVQSKTDATKNFPGTGFPDAWFYLIAGGVDDIGNTGDWKVEPDNTGIKIKIEKAGADRLKVTFEDAILPANGNFVPTEFKIVNKVDAKKNFDYRFRVHTWVTFDAINKTQQEADELCERKGTQIRNKVAWKTLNLRGSTVYGITDEPPPYFAGYYYHPHIRAIIQGPQANGFIVMHEWGDRLFESSILAGGIVQSKRLFSRLIIGTYRYGWGDPRSTYRDEQKDRYMVSVVPDVWGGTYETRWDRIRTKYERPFLDTTHVDWKTGGIYAQQRNEICVRGRCPDLGAEKFDYFCVSGVN